MRKQRPCRPGHADMISATARVSILSSSQSHYCKARRAGRPGATAPGLAGPWADLGLWHRFRDAGRSSAQEEAVPQEWEGSAAVHLALEQLEAGDLALGLPVAPRRAEGG